MKRDIEMRERIEQEVRERYEKEIYDLTQLIEISQGLNSTLDYNILIDSILLTCMGQMQLIKAGIFLKKGFDQEVFVLHRNYKGFELDHSIEYEINTNSDFIYFLGENFRCYTMIELVKIFKDDPSLNTLRIVSPSLIVPLKGKGKLNGIIILGERINNLAFSSTDRNYLMHISSLAGIAIQNAHLYEMATTDMMTKLKLHHFFQTALIEEREIAVRQKTPLSLIMIDIDHFKTCNDNYGHTCGDLVLKSVAKLIMDNIRQIDLASRYGGEEFALILPNTDIDEAAVVAERMRCCIEGTKVRCNDNEIGVTVSIGITEFDYEKDRGNKEMIERADRALYISKQEGRNRITVLT